MEEFSSVLEAISKFIIIPEFPLPPAFQVIQEFKNLPDFLMFPVFLALRHQHHSTSAPPPAHCTSSMEIVHAVDAFEKFATEVQERNRSDSHALNYACQNWPVHLSRAPNPWDDDLDHIFHTFWNCHLLSWLEREWFLKGLRSCLVLVSEGQKFAQRGLSRVQPNKIPPTIDPDLQESTIQISASASTSEMSMRQPSTLTWKSELTVPHIRKSPPHIRATSCYLPSTYSEPPSPTVSCPKLGPVVSHAGISIKRTSDDLGVDNYPSFQSVAPIPTKRPRRDSPMHDKNASK
jgi:hypothetical protein